MSEKDFYYRLCFNNNSDNSNGDNGGGNADRVGVRERCCPCARVCVCAIVVAIAILGVIVNIVAVVVLVMMLPTSPAQVQRAPPPPLAWHKGSPIFQWKGSGHYLSSPLPMPHALRMAPARSTRIFMR